MAIKKIPEAIAYWFGAVISETTDPVNLYHLSHDDLDGDGCLILTSQIRKFPSKNSFHYKNIHNLSAALIYVREALDECSDGTYRFLITDVGGINIHALNTLANMYSIPNRDIRFLVIDHHQVKPDTVDGIQKEEGVVDDLKMEWIFNVSHDSVISIYTTDRVQFIHCENMCATMQYFMWFSPYVADIISPNQSVRWERMFTYLANHEIKFSALHNFVINVDYHDRGLSSPVRYSNPEDIYNEDLCPHAEMLDTLHRAIRSKNSLLPGYAKMNTEQLVNMLSEALLNLPFQDTYRIMLIIALEANNELYKKFYDGLIKDVHMKGDKSLIISDKIPTETGTDDFIMAIQVPEELVNEQFVFAYVVDAAHDLTVYPYSDFSKRIFLVEDQEINLIFRVNTHYNSVDIRARNSFPCAFAVASFNDGGGHPCAAGFPIKE